MKQEYRRMMEQIKLTDEEKGRIMDNIESKHTNRSRRPGRKAAVLAIAAVLIIAAMGAGVAWRQVSVHFIRDLDELDAMGNNRAATGINMSERQYHYDDSDIYPEGYDWVIDHGKMSYDLALEITEGGPGDCWTRHRMRVMEGRYAGGRGIDVRDDIYRGDSLARLGELWDVGWDLSWVDTHYEARPNALAQFRTDVDRGAPRYSSFSGAYQGEDGQDFILSYERHTEADIYDVDYVYTNDYTEQYVTRDGVSVSIVMGDNQSGEPMFEAEVWYNLNPGYVRFNLTGVYMEPDEIHTLLDSLHLSNLTK